MNSVAPSTRPRITASSELIRRHDGLTTAPPRRAPRTSARCGRRENSLRLGDRRLAHRRVPRRVAQQLDRPPAHRLDRADRLEDAVDAVVDHLGQPAGAGRDDGRAAGHRLERRQAERLGLRRQQEEIARLEQRRDASRAGRGSARPSATPSSRASFSASTRSGPSPIMSSVAGMARRIRANTRTTSFTRFTSRKLETWVRSPGAPPARAARGSRSSAGAVLLRGSRSWGSPGCRS